MNTKLLSLFFMLLNISLLRCMENITCNLEQLNHILTQISIHLDDFVGRAIEEPQIEKPKGIGYLETFRLKPLTEKEQEAGVENSEFYTAGLDYDQLHKEGNIVDTRFLEHFFFNSIFQNYIHRFLTYDTTYNYKQFIIVPGLKMNQYDTKKFTDLFQSLKLSIMQDKEEQLKIIDSILNALDALKKNELLKKLAISYQRMKIIVEKLELYVQVTRKDDLLTALINGPDRIATDLQAIIFHMMKEGIETYRSNLLKAQTDAQKAEAGSFLATFKPDWLQAPYYANIIQRLDDFMKPQKTFLLQLPDKTIEIPLPNN